MTVHVGPSCYHVALRDFGLLVAALALARLATRFTHRAVDENASAHDR